MASRLLARLGRLEAVLLSKDAPTHRLQIVWVDSDGSRTIGETYLVAYPRLLDRAST